MIVIGLKPGQLGNQLWLFSHFIAFSQETGVPVLNPAFTQYAEHFEGTRAQAISRFPPGRSRHRTQLGDAVYRVIRTLSGAVARVDRRGRFVPIIRLDFPRGFRQEDTFDLSRPDFRSVARSRRLLVVKGWQFTNGPSLAEHRPLLRKYFAPHPGHRERIGTAVARARKDVDVLVGVHVRRGDSKGFLGGRYFFDLKVYDRALQELVAAIAPQRVGFLVCSDDPSACSDLNGPVQPGPGDAIGDLYALSQCDYLIGPPSTYSMWASFYGQVPLGQIDSDVYRVDLREFVVRESQFPFEPAPQERVA